MNQCHQISLEDKETDAFLDEMHKKKVSNEIRQRKREKKLSQLHVLSRDLSSTTCESFQADLFMTKHAFPEQVVKESTPKESFLVLMKPQKAEEKQVNLSEVKGTKIPYNQKVKQDSKYRQYYALNYFKGYDILLFNYTFVILSINRKFNVNFIYVFTKKFLFDKIF
ncbi:hypothetical protein RclHR1_08250009 [Rhizophagus clarus]|uniref:Uncharacterized protein n=1 Tax=Rhizophagus clarus TaxID=94130 RepID=A0A2Z6SFF9_9GLOM|nr:hypothetical protein RclHR1_08250009 [Rhizophagus clarus]GES92510.1 hypothetical protein GLOIN_2v1882276 [Rhizophagus clarus]